MFKPDLLPHPATNYFLDKFSNNLHGFSVQLAQAHFQAFKELCFAFILNGGHKDCSVKRIDIHFVFTNALAFSI